MKAQKHTPIHTCAYTDTHIHIVCSYLLALLFIIVFARKMHAPHTVALINSSFSSFWMLEILKLLLI